ncbi:hypothetical protein BOTBODRAFT_451051 [Botryobasidium botryosum FD-172 SS1]|uniref:Uncharacterized protein n=1 Tax=Botryobasidium botryosum (strain FD-172 SS1) TaxID=930990 RepID=A0A067MJK6_BOTB1|nr:hypothetical protein BOTBODRAFT_451051 [Botryobasidium botryosum FD-172 SS1]
MRLQIFDHLTTLKLQRFSLLCLGSFLSMARPTCQLARSRILRPASSHYLLSRRRVFVVQRDTLWISLPLRFCSESMVTLLLVPCCTSCD